MKKRKAIPDRVKLIAALRRMGLTIEQVQFDHNPALELRPIDPETGDTIPPANSPDHIDLLLITEHKTKTFGRGGDKRITTAGSDIGNIKKLRHLTKDEEAFRRRLLAKAEGEPEPKKKSRWPSRPFGKRGRP
ncbi:hypothetical protein EOA24_00510 [Mesorhizobium sp. M2A.F.Ca.ET.039.01.1.1]|nr:hypothetical protein EOA24_00510 [Mesorhizobium sp. M2A.F.Ca.ET.039.01.1.1]